MKKQCSLPSSASLFGTTHVPPIDNQGAIGSCASQSITRNQFSNALSRYLHSIGQGQSWSPRDNQNERCTPRFTYTLSGAGTSWVYDILKEHGVLFEDEYGFMKSEQGGSVFKDKEGKLYTETTAMPVKEGQMEKALNYRLNSYRQVWVANDPYNARLTTSELGQKLLCDIKEAILRGDLVVTGGYPGRWVMGKIDGCGDLGKIGEECIVAAAGNGSGGHQVTVVGYDDNVTATFGGVQLKGAFLIANSYGAGWHNHGLTWVMYDSVNTVSEHEALNDNSLYSGPMHITPAKEMRMYPASLAFENQVLDFEEDGSCEIYGKIYPAFTVKDGDKYLGYKPENSERELFLSEEKSGRFAFVPYEDMMAWETSDKQYYKEEYKGSYWVYGVDKEGNPEGMRVLDAGTGYKSSGRKANFASHNTGRYPEAKSWNLDTEPKGSFRSKLSIAAGKGEQSERIWTLDQFCFVDWRKDVTVGMPDLYAKVTISANNRDCFKIYLTRKEKGGRAAKKHLPALFRLTDYHPVCCDRSKGEYLNFEGVLNGGECTGYFALSFLPLLKLPKGKTVTDYEWGIELKKGRKGKATLLDGELLDSRKNSLASAKAQNNTVIFKL